MCGIVGYIGNQNAAPILIEGLSRLEYRGYDSAGIAILGSRSTQVFRRVGRVRDLEASLPRRLAGKIGIGHTRWATHGPATEENAHPQTSEDGRISVVHNGIIDNAASLRERLDARGVKFTSETDTEVIAHLIARSEAPTLEAAVLDVLSRITGTYAIAVLDTQHPDRLVVARNGSPLILGVGDREMFVASDLSALVRHTTSVVHLDDGELATVTATEFRTFSQEQENTEKVPTSIDIDVEDVGLGGYRHYMRKEIIEQPSTIERMLRGRLDERFGTARLDGLNLGPRELRGFRRVKILGCGSAYYVGQIGASMIEELARIPADAEPASEFRYRNPIIEPDTLYVAVSQSGETADTAFAVQEVKRKGGEVIGLVNVVGSTIARESDGGIYLHAGPEVAVASTKALTHMASGSRCSRWRWAGCGTCHRRRPADHRRAAQAAGPDPGDHRRRAAHRRRRQAAWPAAQSLFFIGRVRGYPVAREGAQKFKEVSYRHAEAYQASELKHGPLALIDEDLPTVAILPDDELPTGTSPRCSRSSPARGPVAASPTPASTPASWTSPASWCPRTSGSSTRSC